MNQLKIAAVKKAVQILENMECKFHIVMDDGTCFGEKISEKKKQKSNHKHGTLTTYFKPLIKNTKPGEVVVIPWLDYNKKSLASSLTAHLTTNWGANSYVYETKGESFHVLRMA